MSSLGDTLREEFLDGQNRIEWADLAGAVTGGLTLQWFRGGAAIPLAIGRGIGRIFDQIGSAYRDGVSLVSDTLVTQTDAAFGTADFGLPSFPIAVVLILLSLAIVIIGFQQVVFDE